MVWTHNWFATHHTYFKKQSSIVKKNAIPCIINSQDFSETWAIWFLLKLKQTIIIAQVRDSDIRFQNTCF
jgi:hypothetical protein